MIIFDIPGILFGECGSFQKITYMFTFLIKSSIGMKKCSCSKENYNFNKHNSKWRGILSALMYAT